MTQYTDEQIIELVNTLRVGWIRPTHTPSEFATSANIIEQLHSEVKELRRLLSTHRTNIS